jgi:hypothetical protein
MGVPLVAIFGAGYIASSLRGYGDLVFMNRRATLAETYILSNVNNIPDSVLGGIHWNSDRAGDDIKRLREVNEGIFGTAQNQAAALKALQLSDQSTSAASAIARHANTNSGERARRKNKHRWLRDFSARHRSVARLPGGCVTAGQNHAHVFGGRNPPLWRG